MEDKNKKAKKHHKQKESYCKVNKLFISMSSVFLALIVIMICITAIVGCTYNFLHIKPLSAKVEYKNDIETLNDDYFLTGVPTFNTNYRGKEIPEIKRTENGDIVLDGKDKADIYLDYCYTGDEKVAYHNGNYWNDVIEVSSKFPGINTSRGWQRTYDQTLSLKEDGWYSVFAIWWENGKKYHVADTFRGASFGDEEIRSASEIQAYQTWNENKNKVKKIEGVENYLFIGADYWDDSAQSQCYSDLLTLVTINHNNKEVSITTISKESYVYIPTIGCARLANAYNAGSTELVTETIMQNYGVYIDRYLLLDYENYIDAVNHVGGIDIYIEDYQVPFINNYIDDLLNDSYNHTDLETTHLEESDGVVRLDGVQSLAYMRYYNEGDLPRSKRFYNTIKSFAKSAGKSGPINVIKNVFPTFTTDISYHEYVSLILDLPTYIQYDIKHYKLPGENRVADFKESGGHTVLFNDNDEINQILDKCIGNHPSDKMLKTNWLRVLLYTYVLIMILVFVATLYISLIHRRGIEFIDVKTGEKYYGRKKYAWNSDVHLFHQGIDKYFYIKHMYADRACTLEFTNKVKMPMHILTVYMTGAGRGKRHTEKKEQSLI